MLLGSDIQAALKTKGEQLDPAEATIQAKIEWGFLRDDQKHLYEERARQELHFEQIYPGYKFKPLNNTRDAGRPHPEGTLTEFKFKYKHQPSARSANPEGKTATQGWAASSSSLANVDGEWICTMHIDTYLICDQRCFESRYAGKDT